MAFEDFDPIFSKPKVKWDSESCSSSCPFFLHAYAPDSSHLVIHVTNIYEGWETLLSLSMLEDIVSIIVLYPRNNNFMILFIIIYVSLFCRGIWLE